jgi:hypothetical protein
MLPKCHEMAIFFPPLFLKKKIIALWFSPGFRICLYMHFALWLLFWFIFWWIYGLAGISIDASFAVASRFLTVFRCHLFSSIRSIALPPWRRHSRQFVATWPDSIERRAPSFRIFRRFRIRQSSQQCPKFGCKFLEHHLFIITIDFTGKIRISRKFRPLTPHDAP